jgi:hypothetical protein
MCRVNVPDLEAKDLIEAVRVLLRKRQKLHHSQYKAIKKLLSSGALVEAESALGPFLNKGDLDARYLRASFCLDSSISEDEYDKVRWKELLDLANLGQRNALFDVAYELYHGGELALDRKRGFMYMVAAALLGHNKARILSAAWIDEDCCLSVELVPLVQGKRKNAVV